MSTSTTEIAEGFSGYSGYQFRETAGSGDCAFHAVLGDWNEAQHKYVCRDVATRRQGIASIIITRKYDELIFGVIKEAIQQLVIGSDRGSSEITTLRTAYKRYCDDNQQTIDAAWQIFERELRNYPQVLAYIAECMQAIPEKQRSRLGTLRLQFQQCLDMHDGELYGRILSIESLDMAFKEYNKATTISFDLDGYFRSYPQVIDEYANLIIGTQGQWLLPCELALIAYALNITIVFYTKDLNTHNPRYIETYNPGQPNSKLVCFNGVNHYERLTTRKPAEKPNKRQKHQALDPGATCPLFITARLLSNGAQATDCTCSGNTVVGELHEHYYQLASQSKPKTNDTLRTLQDCLCAQYLTEQYLARIFDKTKIPIIESYINLALIKQETQKTKEKQHTQIIEIDGKSQTEMLDVHRLPSHEEIYAAKESMPLEQLFTAKEGEPAPRKLLILGKAGIGKTVLCQYLAVRWALAVQQPSIPDAAASSATIIPLPWLNNFAAVFWLKLREIKIPDTGFKTQYGLAELIRAKCLYGPKKPSLKLKQLNSYLQENSEKILFILDGYDEIESIIGNEQYSIFNTIFTELTQYRNVILTSRPTCSCTFTADRTLENMGFIDQNVIDYITKFMHGTEVNIENFISYLKSSPSIWGIAHIPINLEMLCYLCKMNKLDFTAQTLSALYQQVVTRLTLTMADQMLGQVSKYPALQEKVIKDVALKFLELLAYNAMLGNELLITSSTIQKTVHILNITDTALIEKLLLAGNNLGFIKTTNEGGRHLSDQAHYFIHLSFQEYFAAKYIAEAFLRGNQEVIDLIRQEKYQPRYQLMLWFVAGLLYLHGKQHTSDFTALNLFWQVLLDEPQDLFGLKQAELVAHCLDECLADEKVEILKHLLEVLGNWLVYCLKEDNHRSFFYDQILYRCKHMLASEVISNLLLQVGANQSIDVFLRIQSLSILSKASQLSEDTTCRGLLDIAHDSRVDVRVGIEVLDMLSKVSQPSENIYRGLRGIANDPLINARIRTKALDMLSKVSQYQEVAYQGLLDIAYNSRLKYRVRIRALDVLSKVSQPSENTYRGLWGIANDPRVDARVRIKALNVVLSKVSQPSEDNCRRLLGIAHDSRLGYWVRTKALDVLSKVSQLSEDNCRWLLGIAKDSSVNAWFRIQALDMLSKVSQPSENTCRGLLDIAHDSRLEYGVRTQALYVLSKVSPLSENTCQRLLGIAKDSSVDAMVRIDALDVLSKVSQYQKVACQRLLGIVKDSSVDAMVRIDALDVLSKVSPLSENTCQRLLGIAKDSSVDAIVGIKALDVLSKVSQYQEVAYQRLLGIAKDSSVDAMVRIDALDVLSKVSQPSENTCRWLLDIAHDPRLKYWVRTQALYVLSKVSPLSENTCQRLLGIAKDSSVDAIVGIKALDILSKVSKLSKNTRRGLLDIAKGQNVDAMVRIKALDILSKVSKLSKNTRRGLLDIAKGQNVDAMVRIKALDILSKVSKLSENTCQRLLGIAKDSSVDAIVGIKALDVLSKVSQLSKDTCQWLFGIAHDSLIDTSVRIQVLDVLSKVSPLSENTCQRLLGIAKDSSVDAIVGIKALYMLSKVSQLSEDTCRGLLSIAHDHLVETKVRTKALDMLSKVSQLSEDTCRGLLGIAHDSLVEYGVRRKSVDLLFSGKNFTVWVNEKTNVKGLFSVCLTLVNPLVMTCNIFKTKDNFSINSQLITLPLHKLREIIQTFKQKKGELGIPCFSTTIARESMLTPLIEGNALKPKPKRNPLPYPSQGQITFNRLIRINDGDWQPLVKNTSYTLRRCDRHGFPAVKIELVREATIDLTTVLAAALEESLKIPNIYYIDLSGNNLANIALLINAIHEEHPTIPLNKFYGILVLSNNHITGHAFEELLMALAEHPCITTLLLDRNQIYFEPIFITRKVNSLSFLVERASINLIDLTLNFIPKGFEFTEEINNKIIRIYYDRKDPIFQEQQKTLERVCIKTFFAASSYIYSNRFSQEILQSALVTSLIAALDPANPNKILDSSYGMIGLFANNASGLLKLPKEHAYIMLEGISHFGQRYLIRGELFKNQHGVVIIISPCSPEIFSTFAKQELAYCKTARISRQIVKTALQEMVRSRNNQGFMDYAMVTKYSEKGVFNCLKWAQEILKVAGIENAERLFPSDAAKHSNCLIM